MRHSFFTAFCLAGIVQTANSQLTLLPRIGVENSKALVSVNDSKFFTPGSSQFAPQAGIRLDYKFKKGHGIFAGASTGNSTVAYNFTNPETSLTDYFISRSNTQLRLEGGYQFNTKPVFIKKNSAPKKSASQKNSNCSKKEESNMNRRCGSYTQRSSCSQKTKSENSNPMVKKSPMSVSFQPLIGMAFVPSLKSDFVTKNEGRQPSYSYHAANWNTALMAGMGFEFANNKTKLFRVNLQYLVGLGNLNNKTLTTQSNNKNISTNYTSGFSAWNLSFGVPVSFTKKPAAKNKTTEKIQHQQKKHCEQIRIRCSGIRI